MISDTLFLWMTHSKVKKTVMRHLKFKGVHVQPIENLGNRGVPDLNCCYRNQEFWIEIKVKPDKLSDLQRSWIHQRRSVGGRCYVLYVDNTKLVAFWDWSDVEYENLLDACTALIERIDNEQTNR